MRHLLAALRSSSPVLILLAGAAWIVLSARDTGAIQAGPVAAPQQGFLAPEFSLQTLSAETVRLSNLRGRPVLVNIWASWCGPCRAEMPAMERVYREHREQGFVVLAVNATHQDSRQAALAFVRDHGLTFPILLDSDGMVSNLYRLRALPSSYFIGKDGVVREVIIGGPMAEALLRTRVERLLQEAP